MVGSGIFSLRSEFKRKIRRFLDSLLRNPRYERGKGVSLTKSLTELREETIRVIGKLGEVHSSAVLVATGGFSRSETCPFSDTDLLLIVEDGRAKEDYDWLVRFLWDSGIDPSVSIRTVRESLASVKKDLNFATSVLSARPIFFWKSGEELWKEFKTQFQSHLTKIQKDILSSLRHLNPESMFFTSLCDTSIKDSSFTLRGINALEWLSLTINPSSLNPIMFLSRVNLIPESEADKLMKIKDFFLYLRFLSHSTFGRREDLLVDDVVNELSMKLYPVIDDRFLYLKRQITYMGRVVYRNLLSVFGYLSSSFKMSYIVSSENDFVEALKKATARKSRLMFLPFSRIEGKFMENIKSSKVFWEWLNSDRVYEGMKLLFSTGKIYTIFPSLYLVKALPSPEPIHDYPVDGHTLKALKELDRVLNSTDETVKTAKSFLMEKDLAVLRFAVLLHDVGRVFSDSNHSEEGGRIAEVEMQSVPWFDEKERNKVRFLVENHLNMFKTAVSRDLSEPDVVKNFALIVENPEKLSLLYLMTLADAKATGRGYFSEWMRELVDNLFRKTLKVMETDWNYEDVSAVKVVDEVMKKVEGSEADFVVSFVKAMPMAYLRVHGVDDILNHARTLRGELPEAEVARKGSIAEVKVFAEDKKGLLSRICGVMSAFGLNILRAVAYTSKDGKVIDEFVVEDRSGGGIFADPEFEGRLKEGILKWIKNDREDEFETWFKEKSHSFITFRRSRIKSQPSLSFEQKNGYFIVDLFAPDRLGLLYDVMRFFSSKDFEVVNSLAVTRNGYVDDTFYVKHCSAENLSERELKKLVDELKKFL